MAAKTSLRVSLLVLLVVLYLDCSLQDAQASPTGNILPTWAKKGLEVPEGHLPEKTVTVFKGNNTGNPKADPEDLLYRGEFPPVKGPTNNTLCLTYPDNFIVLGISVSTWWDSTVGNVTLTDIGPNYWALTWEVPPGTFVYYEVIITIIIIIT
jgi:hypothetical protein